MQGPGQSLRQEREAHGRTIEEMSEATGIRLPFLTALEQDAFDSLPGRGFGKLYIRAYAEVLGFDPRPVVEAYDRAVRETDVAAAPASEPAAEPRPANAVLARWRAELIARRAEADALGRPEDLDFDQVADVEDEPEPARLEPGAPTAARFTHLAEAPFEEVLAPSLSAAAAVSPSRPARSPQWLVATLLLLVVLPLAAYLVFVRSTPEPEAAALQEPAVAKAVVPLPAPPQPPRAVEAPHPAPGATSPGREPATLSSIQAGSTSLKVAESGVGRRIVGTRLEGEGHRFVAGQRATFATRVLGGTSGDHIRHVWLRDGKVEQSIRLRLGGASWRTHSTKTLGRPGAWAVEALDEQGRVLARADLTVAP